MVTEDRLVHPLKVLVLMDVTPSGMTMDCWDEQPLKAELPMFATLAGISIEPREEHP
ncbi:MAG: hypothetical protein LUB61_07905 [Eggerthellaceae bacterium]|nr:hypothetical protein [Eggerthellaceae bacterium]